LKRDAFVCRQLNNYGFRKVNPDRYEFASPGFIKGKCELLATLQRADAHRRQKKTQEEGTSYPPGEDLHDTVETLKADKTYLNEEVDYLRRENVQSKGTGDFNWKPFLLAGLFTF
jgi:heat shock transcription factor